MSIQWAGLGPEILLELDRERPEPLRLQLERGLRDAIRSGRLKAGERLPSSREMARELGVSRGLVLECYTQLQAEGYLTSRGGSATRVASGAEAPPSPPPPPATQVRPSIDFKHGLPDLASFPRRDWAWAMREACRGVPAGELGYGDAERERDAAGGARRLPAPGARRRRGARADRGLLGGPAGSEPGHPCAREARA